MNGGWRLEVVDEIGSTSDGLIRRAEAGERGDQALMARRQLAGRGRRGRSWEMATGNLALSVLLRPDLSSDEVAQVVFVAGLALCQALQAHLADAWRLRLKWPNDVLLDEHKLGGILVESALDQAGRVEWLVIGFGANLVSAPVLADCPTSCLADAIGVSPAVETVASSLLACLDQWLATWQRHGFGPVRSAWMRAAHREGTPMSVDGREGRFAGLSDDGHLLMEVAGAVEVVRTGEVIVAGL